MSKIKVQLTFDQELLKKIDDVSDSLHISRSALISIAVSEFVHQKKNIDFDTVISGLQLKHLNNI